jgi:hypothetical protein
MPNVNDSIAISENVELLRLNAGVQIYINDVKRTSSIIPRSLKVENIITRQVDKCNFTLRKFGDIHTYIPTVGKEVAVYNDGVKLFGGIITRITQRAEDYKIILFDVECEDFTRLLDRKLVINTYKNQTIGQIIDNINTNFLTDFTTNNVLGVDKVVAYIAFNYVPVSEALKELADLINYDWYVDFEKDIHFFSKTQTDSPFNLADDDGNFIFDSLRIRRDNSQVRNVIIVRGGEYLADTFTTEYISDGTQNIYPLPYKYDELQANVTGEIWDQGIDGRDTLDSVDYLWNETEKFIRFRGDRIPSNTSTIRLGGPPFLPVIIEARDQDSIDSMVSSEGGTGEYEFLIVDKTIDSREGARERATADLQSYKDTLSEGTFKTYTDGLIAGQRITINSSAHGINESFIINKVTAKMWTNEALIYTVSVVTTKTLGIIEFLQDLLIKSTKEILIDPNEVVDVIRSKNEAITISEVISSSLEHNPQAETVTMNETLTVQSIDYEVEFVAGPQVPSGLKRVFVTNGSRLG